MLKLSRRAQSIIDRVEAGRTIFTEDVSTEKRALAALRRHPRDILKMQNVLGVAYGYLSGDDVDKGKPDPIVYVTKKVPLSHLKKPDQVPKTVKVGRLRMTIRVLAIGGVEQVCNPGDRTPQRTAHNPYQPGCVIADLLPPNNTPVQLGTGGCCVRKSGDPAAPIFLLTASHVIPANHNVGHPGNQAIGSWVADAAGGYDACLCEVSPAIAPIKCLGHPNQAQRPPLGAIVKKSGAGTGVTVSRVLQMPNLPGHVGTTVAIENAKPLLPPPAPQNPVPFLTHSDSGSVTMMGWPWFDLGPVTEAKIHARVAGHPPNVANHLTWMLRAQFFNAVVSLNYGQSNLGAPNGLPFLGFGHLASEVLGRFTDPMEIVS